MQTYFFIAYEPAYGIIGDKAKWNPTTRQSADHSMVYIISTMLKKAFENKGNYLIIYLSFRQIGPIKPNWRILETTYADSRRLFKNCIIR